DYIECERGKLKGIDMDMNTIPDAAMTIATTALFAEGETTIRNIYNWRVKETDRLSAMATELRKVGAMV
ncbi:3-phosphoshikimate 1-carboxyvinyltransferase, partial [Proteus mirabilis]